MPGVRRVRLLGVQHQLSSGGLLLFTFFMITDPMTTPNDRRMRWLYAGLVATLAFVWQFVWYRNGGPVWALFLLSPLVPLLDWLRPGAKHQWRPQPQPATAPVASMPAEVPCAPSSATPTVRSTA